jgi:hypothetical protein
MNDADHGRSSEHADGQDRLRFHLRKLQRHPGYLAARAALRMVRTLPSNAWRMATHQHRELPSAIIVGAQKAGTTQLFEGLLRHPCCFGSVRKELNYFSYLPGRPLLWYRSRFPLSRTVHRAGGICLEASPSYLPSPVALQRMSDVLPDARVVVVLRDPVARAFSHYQHLKTRRRENRSFAEAVHDIWRRGTLAAELGAALKEDAPPMLDYISWSYYALQLDALWRVYPREQTLVLESAELFADTDAACQRAFSFLGLEPFQVTVEKIFNRGYYRETIDPAIAEELRAHYRPHDELLAKLTGRTFRWMDSSRRAGQWPQDSRSSDRAA